MTNVYKQIIKYHIDFQLCYLFKHFSNSLFFYHSQVSHSFISPYIANKTDSPDQTVYRYQIALRIHSIVTFKIKFYFLSALGASMVV